MDEVIVVAVVARTVVSDFGADVLGSTLDVPEKIAWMTRTPMGTNEVVQVATPAVTATESHPVITALSAVNATVPAEAVGVTVAVNVTDADDWADDALRDSTVADVVDVAAGVIVTAPLPV
jgi:hypothetical protein